MTANRRSSYRNPSRVSRRTLMRTAAGASLGLGLASGGATRTIAQDTASPTPEITFDFSGSGIELPSDDLTFRWLNSGPGPKGVFLAMMFDAYQKAHSTIKVEYDQLPWNEIAKVVPLGIRSENAHDVFQVPQNVPDAQAVAEGWVAPLDDLMPDFEEWKKNFPPGSFINGFTDFGGKTYTFPVSSNKRYGTLLLYNQTYMDEAGLDPYETPFTWNAFRDAAKKLTEQGDGQYYGLIFEGNQTGRFAEFVRNLARMAGRSASGDDIDWRTGEYVFTSDEYIAAIELLLAIRDDGSVFPGSLALNAHEARARVPQGMAAMILQGPWNIPTWQADAPDFAFGVASQPVPNEGEPLPLTVGPGGSNAFYIYAGSPYKEVAADVFHYLGTPEGQSNWGKVVGIADPPTSPEALAAANLDELSMRAATFFEQQIRLGPDPRVRNPEAAQVYLETQTITPDFGATVQGLFADALNDVKGAMQDLQDKSEAELERAIKAAQDEGASVSRDDWVYPNWDPTKDYLPEDYDAL